MTRRFERRRVIERSRPSHDRWLVSYADFVTLMFAFFTTLYAISSVDAQKLGTMANSLSEAFDQPADAPAPLSDRTDPTVLEAAARARELSGLREQLTTHLEDDIASDLVDVRLDGRGLVISLHEAGAFVTASADLSANAEDLIATVGAAILDLENIVRVEGHTDDVPILTSRYQSNWELSTARATSVVSFLVDRMGIPANRMAIAGYGEFRPLAPNDSEANRARNRRVDIVVLSSETARTEEPA